MKEKSKFILWIATFIGFLTVVCIYLLNLERVFIIQSEIIRGLRLRLPLPVLFYTVIFTYIFVYTKLSSRKLIDTFFLVLPLAIFWKLVFFLIEMIGVDLWAGHKPIFTIYSHIYLTLAVSLCLMIVYKLKNYLKNTEKPLVIIPAVSWIIYLLYQIMRTHSYIYLALIPLTLFFFLKLKPIFKFINSKRDLLFLLLVFVLAFGIRFGWGLRVISITGTNFYAASDDGITYGPYAEDWAKGISHSALAQYGGFGYWVFLGIIYKIFGNPNYYAAIFIQAILGALVPLCTYYIAKRITNPVIAKISAILVSLNTNSVFTSIVIGMEAVFIPLVFICLSLLLKYIDTGKIKLFHYPFLIGIILGITNIVRMELTAFLIVIVLCFFLFHKNRFDLKESFKIVLSLALGFLVILFSFSLRNYLKEGKFDFKSQSAGIGFSLTSSGEVKETNILSDMGFNPFLDLRSSLKVLSQKPLIVTRLLSKGVLKKSFNYLTCPNFGEMDFLTLINNTAMEPPLRFPLYCQFYIYLFVLMGLIILSLDKKYRLEKGILFGYIAYTILIYAVIWTRNARHRAVLEPLFILLFTFMVYLMVDKFKSKRNYVKNKIQPRTH